MEDGIINKVSESKIISFDMEEVLPKEAEILEFDIAPFLFQGLVLREKDFRLALKELDWTTFQDKYVWVHCSTDSIVPIWAYMLISTYLQNVAKSFAFSKEEIFINTLKVSIQALCKQTDLTDRPVVIKGCSNIPYKESMYLEATKLFLPYAKSIMYGEPCSTVPIFKRK
jgi:hypothetical protein